jgi:hypothetical protein
MRGFTRTLLARTFAALLSVLAASPVTAPFMTCDWSELGHVRIDVVAHVGRHVVSAPDVKTPSDLNTTLFSVIVTTVVADDDGRQYARPLPLAPEHRPQRALVLRI